MTIGKVTAPGSIARFDRVMGLFGAASIAACGTAAFRDAAIAICPTYLTSGFARQTWFEGSAVLVDASGWFLVDQVAWLANLLTLASFGLLLIGRPSQIVAVAGLAVASLELLPRGVDPRDLLRVCSLGRGYWLWLAAAAIPLTVIAITTTVDRLRPSSPLSA